ncbi:TPA_asm: nucleocapsid protein [birds-foot trefoil-associated virus]|uniref:Nucleoprotein n=1 Tax=birds-foot trefoil-associated virus TaxID=3121202 RepID=A0A9Y0T896_9RHAB|nr:TPA_asm: nucleocapsid protein [Bird's-foot trefoil nucleorhabdovirus]
MADITLEELKAIRPQYTSLSSVLRPEISSGQCVHREYTFQDAARFPIYKVRDLKNDEIVSIFKNITEVKKSLNERDLYNIVSIALNVKDPFTNQRTIPDPFTPDVRCADFETAQPSESSEVNMLKEGGVHTITTIVPTSVPMETSDSPTESIDEQASAICFLFAWLTRYVVKSPSQALSIQYSKVQDTYMKFYQKSSKIFDKFQADKLWILSLRNAFDAFLRVRNTLVLYVANAETVSKATPRIFNLLRYLFFQNLEFMGMHAYVSIVMIMSRIALPPAQILTWLRMSGSELAIDEAYKIMANHDNGMKEGGATSERLWKYARILDAGYFNQLQTSYAAELIATLAYIEIKLGISKEAGHSSPLNITVIADNKHIRDIGKAKAEAFMECKARSISLARDASAVDKIYAKRMGLDVSNLPPPERPGHSQKRKEPVEAPRSEPVLPIKKPRDPPGRNIPPPPPF